MIQDTMIQALASNSHVNSDGSAIGGVDPKVYGSMLVPGADQSLLLWTEGNTGKPTDYPAWMWFPASPRPILKNNGNCRLSFEAMIAGDIPSCNVVETDLLIVTNGLKYNRSLQYNQALGFQIADVNGEWVSTGWNMGPMVADRAYEVSFDNTFNSIGSSTTKITRNGITQAVPAKLQNVPAQASNWLAGAYVQIQMGSMPGALAWQLLISKLQIEWY